MLAALLVIVTVVLTAQTASAKQYTQPFQNPTTSLAGKSVQANMYFVKMGYWDVKKATLNLKFQISQLDDRQNSDITVSVNGVTFDSFRPSSAAGEQSKQITIPKKLIQSQNNLQIEGQLLNQTNDKQVVATQTPANWLTLDSASNVNFDYDLTSPRNQINDFYDRLTGADTIAESQSLVETPKAATDTELSAGLRALTGLSRFVTSDDQALPISPLEENKQADYQVIIAKFQHLPKSIQSQLSAKKLNDQAVIKLLKQGRKHLLVVTSNSDSLLLKAASFVANQELMKETTKPEKWINEQTATFSSVLEFQGRHQLTDVDTPVQGAGHNVRTFFVQLPNDQLNAAGSTINLRLRYGKNLDFKRSLMTVRINQQAIGSQRLSAAHADGDEISLKLPAKMPLNSTFTISVDFDLTPAGSGSAPTDQDMWATVLPTSNAVIRSKSNHDLLFDNYPSVFMKNQAVKQMAIVRPAHLTTNDFATMSNLLGLVGNYAKQNTGELKVYHQTPKTAVLNRSNVIAFGTPSQTPLIKQLNSKLYFQFNSNFSGFKSNEKLSLEDDYAQTIGTAQLLRSPYNQYRGLLVVTGAHDDAVYRASTQLDRQSKLAQYRQADTIVVDDNNQHYSYRFKKQKMIQPSSITSVVHKHSHFWLFLGIALVVFFFFGFVIVSILWRNGLITRKGFIHEH
nr:cellulose biosynthesis cyclic di-GMP-binding regulatory protein BcsB [Secundilactobacillus folii]